MLNLVAEAIARAGREQASSGLTERAAWRTMTSDEVIDWVFSHPLKATPTGRIVCDARRFGDLDVLVSLVQHDTRRPDSHWMPTGYLDVLDGLVGFRGIRVGKTDIAHWMLCLDDRRTAVYLAYISADRDIPALLPLDLLSDKER